MVLLASYPALSAVTQVYPPTNAITSPIVAAGLSHALAIRADGTVWALGNSYEGQMGVGYRSSSVTTSPIRITNVIGAVAVAAGALHSMILDHNGRVWTCGYNAHWQLGPVAENQNHQPVPIIVPNLEPAVGIDAGRHFSMAIIADNRKVMAWGDNSRGQLGINSTVPEQREPALVQGLSSIKSLACGFNHALALQTDGTIWAWGANDDGQLGLGTGTATTYRTPQHILNFSNVAAIVAGKYFSMALLSNGNVYVWGKNENSSLGLTNITSAWAPIQNTNLRGIWQIRAGSFQGYAVDTNKAVWVWGKNGGSHGLALGTQINVQQLPTNYVALSNTVFMAGAAKHFISEKHFSIAVHESSRMRVWGRLEADFPETTADPNWHQSIPATLGLDFDLGYGYPVTNAALHPQAYARGTGPSANFFSFVLPLDFQKGIKTVAAGLLPASPQGYHYNATNSAAGLPYQYPIAAFGSRFGGTTLFTDRSYGFIVYGGAPSLTNAYPWMNSYADALKVDIYSKADLSLVSTTNIPIPFYLADPRGWTNYLKGGLTSSLEAFGLTTVVTPRSGPMAYSVHFGDTAEPRAFAVYGVTNNGVLELQHIARNAATNFIFIVKVKGVHGNGAMSLSGDGQPVWQPLYALDFAPSSPWNIRFLSQVHFEREPLPAFYDGKSLEQIMTNSWIVTNLIQVPNPVHTYTNLDQSPELRRHTLLDQFVRDLKHDPLQLARFVQNEIELTDAADYLDAAQVTVARLNLGGINRSALGTFLERQGSPAEQCALLIYLLRQAGVPAVYAFATNNGIKMLDARLSKMLQLQIAGAVNPFNYAINSNRLVSVNYPWVAAHIGGKWIHLFPWIKDIEIVQGANLYDYMPPEYNTAMKWVIGYVENRPEIVSLGSSNDPPEVLFPRYVAQQLALRTPGLSIDDVGTRITSRKIAFNSFDEFPRPTWVHHESQTAETLLDPFLTNSTFRAWNSNVIPATVFNVALVQIISNGSTNIDSGPLRCCDIQNRPLLVYHRRVSGNVHVNLSLGPYNSDNDLQFTNYLAFSNDATLTNKQQLSFQFPNHIRAFTTRITLTRYRASGVSDEISKELPMQKGDLNAICLNYGRVSKEMLEPLAREIWDIERQIKQDYNITNTMSDARYQGGLAYLVGMSYYHKVSRFVPLNQQLHNRSAVTSLAIGTSKLVSKKSASEGDGLPSGLMRYSAPSVDMVFKWRHVADAPAVRPDSGETVNFANDAFALLGIVDGSAKEHDVINGFYKEADAISTVKLLQLSTTNKPKGPVLISQSSQLNDASIYNEDPEIWSQVKHVILASPESQALITPGKIANTAKTHFYRRVASVSGRSKGTGAGRKWSLLKV